MQAELSDKLKQHGVQPTSQRLRLAEIALESHQHFSADYILDRATALGCNISRATVYNTLNLFVEKGLLREILIDPTRVMYDSNTEVHHHLYNVDTGELRDIAPLAISPLPEFLEGEQLDGVDLIIRVRNRRPAVD